MIRTLQILILYGLIITLVGCTIVSPTKEISTPVISHSPTEEESQLLSPERRWAVMMDALEFIEGLHFEHLGSAAPEILVYLDSIPEITSVDVNDAGDTIWLVFDDGVGWTIFEEVDEPEGNEIGSGTGVFHTSITKSEEWFNFETNHNIQSSNITPRKPEVFHSSLSDGISLVANTSTSGSSLFAQPVWALPASIPDNNAYILMNGLEHMMWENRYSPIPKIQRMLDDGGYQGNVVDPTLMQLRLMGAPLPGVLYFRTHGIQGDPERERLAALWTTSPFSPDENDPVILEDLAAGRVGFASAYNRRGPGKILSTHYTINHRFIEHYWSGFERNSLVYLDACRSLSFETILGVLQEKGASVVFGWTGRTTQQPMANTAKFIFDRLLGANQFEPENPPQRSFDYISVFSEHIGQGQNHGFCSRNNASLAYRQLGGGFGLLVPSIMRMDIEEGPEELIVHGLFGDDRGGGHIEVTISGMPLPIITWDNYEIRVGGFKPDLDGEVVVKIMGRESNKVPITSWRNWEMRVTRDMTPYYEVQPRLSIVETPMTELIIHLDLRADVHSYREKPGGDLIKPEITFVQAARSSTFNWQYSHVWDHSLGSIDCRSVSSDGGILEWQDLEGMSQPYSLPQEFFGAGGSINMETSRINICVPYHRLGAKTRAVCTNPLTGESETITTENSKRGGCDIFAGEFENLFPLTIELREYNILADHRMYTMTGIHIDNVEWKQATAQHAPAPDMQH